MKKTLILALLALAAQGLACTNLIVSRGATTDGRTFITYAADSHTRYGQLRYCPAADHLSGETLTTDYPGLGQSAAQVIHNTDERARKHLDTLQ